MGASYEIFNNDDNRERFAKYIERFHETWVSKGEKNNFKEGHSIWNTPVIPGRNEKTVHVFDDVSLFTVEKYFLAKRKRTISDINEEDLVKLAHHNNVSPKKFAHVLKILFGQHNDIGSEHTEDIAHSKYDNKNNKSQAVVLEKDESVDEDLKKEYEKVKEFKNSMEESFHSLEALLNKYGVLIKELEELRELKLELEKENSQLREENQERDKELQELKEMKADFIEVKRILLKKE